MMWVFAVMVGLVLGAVATVAAGRVGHLPPAESRLGAVPGEGPLGPECLRTVRFSLALRGYRMDEVDALLDRVALEWERRDADLARREAELAQREKSPVEQGRRDLEPLDRHHAPPPRPAGIRGDETDA